MTNRRPDRTNETGVSDQGSLHYDDEEELDYQERETTLSYVDANDDGPDRHVARTWHRRWQEQVENGAAEPEDNATRYALLIETYRGELTHDPNNRHARQAVQTILEYEAARTADYDLERRLNDYTHRETGVDDIPWLDYTAEHLNSLTDARELAARVLELIEQARQRRQDPS